MALGRFYADEEGEIGIEAKEFLCSDEEEIVIVEFGI